MEKKIFALSIIIIGILITGCKDSNECDYNKDGKITLAEIQMCNQEKIDKINLKPSEPIKLDDCDFNKDRRLDKNEKKYCIEKLNISE